MARIADFGKQAARNGASAGKFAAKAGAPVAVIGGVIEAGSVIMDPNATTDDKVRGVSEAAGAEPPGGPRSEPPSVRSFPASARP